jgi:hypothetical protein
MSIIGALPFTLINGQTADATQVMADFNTIVAEVNTATVSVGQGGTGGTTLALGAVLVGAGTNPVTVVGPGAAGEILVGQGSADPIFVSGASVNANLANKTVGTSPVMLGFGSTIKLTPAFSGKILLIFNGIVANTVASDGTEIVARYGTGAPPGSGGPVAGTQAGSFISIVNNASTAGLNVPISTTALIVGLTVGTAYWFDLEMFALTGGSATLDNVYGMATELP